jgi:alkylation response protein AidB-like acyl-CoA dehydrogenase
LYETGLLRMFTPRSLGGPEVNPITRALVVEEIAGHDTAAGWTLENPLDWAHLCARLPDEGAEEIYSGGANILIAAQFGRPLHAIPSQDGYRLTGRAPFVSNCSDANWIATTAMVMEGEHAHKEDQGGPEMVMAYFPRGQCQVIDTWNVMGMRGTGSHDIAVTDVLVPKTRTFPMVPEFEPGSHYQGPLYRFPVVGVGATGIAPVMLAVARQAILCVRTGSGQNASRLEHIIARTRLGASPIGTSRGHSTLGSLVALRHPECRMGSNGSRRNTLAAPKS